MSLLQTVYVARPNVPQLDALQAAIDSLGFDCKLDEYYVPFECSGFLPCNLGGKESGFEICFESATETAAPFPNLAQKLGNRDVAITFRWGGDIAECACVLIVSAALAKSFGAIVHYQDDDMLYSQEQLVQQARSIVGGL